MDELGSAVTPPEWSLRLGEVGRVGIIIAAILFVFAVAGWALSPRFSALRRPASVALTSGVVLLFGAFISLGCLFVGNRFEYAYIFEHGDTSNAIAYRIAGIWSGQQGSFLLWACCAGIFLLLTASGAGPFRRWYSIVYGTFLAALSGILAFESPFKLNMVGDQPVVPPNGAGLAPSLQNYWVIIHPPTIFLGFGALTVLFAYAFAAMASKDVDGWLPRVRPWGLVALSVLGLGLCMGGFWAYETLGWGGFWMWDPVENVSLVPWLLTAAFVHGIIVQAARGTKKLANILMGGLPFLTFVYGTFLTRSGFLSNASVHSFAEMNSTALKLLIGVLVAAVVAFFGLLGTRWFQARKVVATNPPAPSQPALGRESLMNMGIATLSAIGLATMFGMSVPFIQAIRHEQSRVVEEGLYHSVLTWFFVPMLVLMAIAPFAPWKNVTARAVGQRFYTVFSLSIGVTGLFLMSIVLTPFGKVIERTTQVTLLGRHVVGLPWILFLFGLCAFALIGNAWRIIELGRRTKLGWAPFLTHIGVAILMIGLIVSRGFEQKDTLMVMKDHPGKALGYDFRYKAMTSTDTDRNNHLLFDVYDANQPTKFLFTAAPGMYKVPAEDGNTNTMVWPSIVHRPLYDVYVALRPPQEQVSDPISLKPGDSKVFGGLVIKYNKMVIDGVPGQKGTAFLADLTISAGKRVTNVRPSIELGGEAGPIHHNGKLDDNFDVSLESMNAADRSVMLEFKMSSPIYPIDIFHKPLVAFVWFGTGLMTLAGLVAAVSRRMPSMAKAPADNKKLSGELNETLTIHRRHARPGRDRAVDHG